MPNYDVLAKIVFVGAQAAGKSSIMLRETDDRFVGECETTIGVEFGNKIYEVGNKKIKLLMYDTSGNESYRSRRLYYRGAGNFVVVIDGQQKFNECSLSSWLNEAGDIPFISVIVSKSDQDLVVDEQAIQDYLAENAPEGKTVKYLGACSAKTGENIREIFQTIAEDCYSVTLSYIEKAIKERNLTDEIVTDIEKLFAK